MKTVALSEEVYIGLLDLKHKLEKRTKRALSFSETIQYLLKKELKGGGFE